MSRMILRTRTENDLFDKLWLSGGSLFNTYLDEILDNVPVHKSRLTTPAFNTSSTDEEYKISVACPGANKEDLSVKIRESVMTVSYEQAEGSGLSQFCNSFQKSWTLPRDSDTENVKAEFKQGVFSVFVPRKPPIEPEIRNVEVE